jgi:hypothetical protein
MTMRERIAQAIAVASGYDAASSIRYFYKHADAVLAAMENATDETPKGPGYRILENVPEYNSIVILWPKELPIPYFHGEYPNKTIPISQNVRFYAMASGQEICKS